jgi:hypothetical protein
VYTAYVGRCQAEGVAEGGIIENRLVLQFLGALEREQVRDANQPAHGVDARPCAHAGYPIRALSGQ